MSEDKPQFLTFEEVMNKTNKFWEGKEITKQDTTNRNLFIFQIEAYKNLWIATLANLLQQEEEEEIGWKDQNIEIPRDMVKKMLRFAIREANNQLFHLKQENLRTSDKQSPDN